MLIEVFPRVFRAGERSKIRIKINEGCQDGTAEISLIPTDGGDIYKEVMPIRKGRISVSLYFNREMEYSLIILIAQDSTYVRLYALEDDLFRLKPLKGDLHIHTDRSDGEDPPAFVAASSREIGMDFIAITDHYEYAPSIEAIESFRDVKTGLNIFPGEEIHPPKNRVHMINFGGSQSINKMFAGKEYIEAVNIIQKTIDKELPENIRHSIASCLWVFDKIREINGVSVFCHPHWFVHNKYDVDERITEYLFRTKRFDVLELIGGYHKFETESNALTVSYWADRQLRYGPIPVVGSGDSHGVTNGRLFGWYYTVAFAKSNEFDDVAECIKEFRTTAVEALPGEAVHVHGQFRYVKYAYFLIREYFKFRDVLCMKEGKFLKTYIRTKKGHDKIVKAASAVEKFRRSFFAEYE